MATVLKKSTMVITSWHRVRVTLNEHGRNSMVLIDQKDLDGVKVEGDVLSGELITVMKAFAPFISADETPFKFIIV